MFYFKDRVAHINFRPSLFPEVGVVNSTYTFTESIYQSIVY